MVRVKKQQATLDSIFFSTPEQKVMRLLVSEPTTSFTPRIIASKLKGVRGMGGAEGLGRILASLREIGLVDFVDNQRAVRAHDDNSFVQILKTVAAICDLESLQKLIAPASSKGVLFGSRATGKARSDSDYDLFVITENPEEVRKIAQRHPLGRNVELVVWTPEQAEKIESLDPGLARKLEGGIVLWGSSW